MKVRDIMTADVCTVAASTPVERVAALLLENRISAAPVVDEANHVTGIVSEGDLMRRKETGTERHRSWWLGFLVSPATLAQEYVKSHGARAGDVMTRQVISVGEDMSAAAVADLLEAHRIKRVPVLRDGKLVGVVSRADLLRVLARRLKFEAGKPTPETVRETSDAAIRKALYAGLSDESWIDPMTVNTVVENGTVELWGLVDTEQQQQALRVLVENIPGVKAVEDNLMVRPITAVAS